MKSIRCSVSNSINANSNVWIMNIDQWNVYNSEPKKAKAPIPTDKNGVENWEWINEQLIFSFLQLHQRIKNFKFTHRYRKLSNFGKSPASMLSIWLPPKFLWTWFTEKMVKENEMKEEIEINVSASIAVCCECKMKPFLWDKWYEAVCYELLLHM